MKITLLRALFGVNVLTLFLLLMIHAAPLQVIRIILGVPYLLFFPGFTLMAAIAPSRKGPDTVERLVLSVALSVVIVPLIGLALNYTSYGIRLEPLLYSVSLFIFLASFVALLKQKKLAGEEKATLEFFMQIPGGAGETLDKVLAVAMVAVVAGTLVTAVYFLTSQKKSESFTQFYYQEQDGNYYLNELTMEDRVEVKLTIVNFEGREVVYRIEVLLNEKINAEIGPIVLSDGQTWQTDAVIVPEFPGQNQQIKFLLFRDNGTKPHLKPLYLLVDVKDKGTVGTATNEDMFPGH